MVMLGAAKSESVAVARTGAGFHSKPNEVSVSGGHIFLIWPPAPLPTHPFFVKASGPEELVIYTIIISNHLETNKNDISVPLFLSFTLLMAMLNPYRYQVCE
jgi:hypothetical protein